MKIIGHIKTDFPEKFGLPRQSGLVEGLTGEIILLPEYRNPDAFRGIDGFSHLWIIWQFSDAVRDGFSPTVRPPRLGGNVRMGVFATRSPFRPNPLGLSCVQIESIEPDGPEGPVINVLGADLMDGTPIYDIKPYVKYADARPHAVCGYVDRLEEKRLKVVLPHYVASCVADRAMIQSLIEILALDPRPSYHEDAERVYGLSFYGYNVRFKVDGDTLTVVEID